MRETLASESAPAKGHDSHEIRFQLRMGRDMVLRRFNESCLTVLYRPFSEGTPEVASARR